MDFSRALFKWQSSLWQVELGRDSNKAALWHSCTDFQVWDFLLYFASTCSNISVLLLYFFFVCLFLKKSFVFIVPPSISENEYGLSFGTFMSLLVNHHIVLFLSCTLQNQAKLCTGFKQKEKWLHLNFHFSGCFDYVLVMLLRFLTQNKTCLYNAVSITVTSLAIDKIHNVPHLIN